MPSKSEAQRKMVFVKRSQYKTKANAPDKWKWVFDKGWETLEESDETDGSAIGIKTTKHVPAEEVAEAEEVGDEFIKKIKNKNTTNLVTKTLFPNEMRSNSSNVQGALPAPIGESKKLSYAKMINEVQKGDVKEQEKLMNKYAKVCGYNHPPFTWKPSDYSIKGWQKLIDEAKRIK